MKTFLKTVIGGALGLGALYIVGKICYEAGKDVAEVERQLCEKTTVETEVGSPEISDSEVSDAGSGEEGTVASSEYWEKQKSELRKVFDDAKTEMNAIKERQTKFQKITDKIRNAKMFLAVRKAFDKSNKSPGILGSLLTNPDGARIEAYVRDGGVQINVKPRAA